MTPATDRPVLNRRTVGIAVFLFLAFILTLRLMGRIWVCECGVGLGTWNAWGTDTSQHLMDPYTLSHILHGIIFFWVLWLFRKKISLEGRLLIALLLEIGWEILENSPLIINRYRAATASLEYFGDSILNSIGDVLAMLLGFWLVKKLPVWATISILIAIELGMLVLMRDNLTLNVLMLLYPVAAIKEWQMAL